MWNGIGKASTACDRVWLLIALPCNHFHSDSHHWMKIPINLKDTPLNGSTSWFTGASRTSPVLLSENSLHQFGNWNIFIYIFRSNEGYHHDHRRMHAFKRNIVGISSIQHFTIKNEMNRMHLKIGINYPSCMKINREIVQDDWVFNGLAINYKFEWSKKDRSLCSRSRNREYPLVHIMRVIFHGEFYLLPLTTWVERKKREKITNTKTVSSCDKLHRRNRSVWEREYKSICQTTDIKLGKMWMEESK